MTRTKWFDVAAVVFAVAVIAGLGFALRPQDTAMVRIDPSTAHVDRPTSPAADSYPSVLFIGDSYTSGGGLRELSYGCMAAVRLHWLCQLSAVPGTGYISGGPANRFIVDPYIGSSTSFIERIPHLAAVYQPDVVVLDGGRNDEFAPVSDVFNAMAATIAESHRAWPEAKIVVVRPRYLAEPGDDLGFDDGFIRRLAAEPAAAGVVFIDPLRQFTNDDTAALLREDGIHPSRRGDKAISSALLDSLLDHGFGVST